MKKLVLFLGLSVFIFANTLPHDLVCKKVPKSEIEDMMGIKFKEQRVGKLPIEPVYDLSFCEYISYVLPDVTIFYYPKCKSKLYFEDSEVKELKDLKFPARIVLDSKDKTSMIIGETKEGSKIMFLIRKGVKIDGKEYKKALKLLEKLVMELKWKGYF